MGKGEGEGEREAGYSAGTKQDGDRHKMEASKWEAGKQPRHRGFPAYFVCGLVTVIMPSKEIT